MKLAILLLLFTDSAGHVRETYAMPMPSRAVGTVVVMRVQSLPSHRNVSGISVPNRIQPPHRTLRSRAASNAMAANHRGAGLLVAGVRRVQSAPSHSQVSPFHGPSP